MNDKLIKIGFAKHLELLSKCLSNLKSGKGSIIAIEGDEGFGKTHLLNIFAEHMQNTNSEIKIILEKNNAPIGKYNLGNMQPLNVFSKVMEKILLGETFDKSSALTKFMKNAGITFLASVPVIDTVFYAVKELGRDWRQYKKDKSSENRTQTGSNTTNDFFDSFSSVAEKKQLLILLDDMHWSDSQSVQLLNLFAESLKSLPIIFIITYRKSELNMNASPLISFINTFVNKIENVYGIKLSEFNKEEISDLIPYYIKNYKTNYTFEQWLYDNSYGVPGVLTEYLRYFAENSPFKEDGNLSESFKDSNFMPSSLHSAFSKTVEKLNDEEKNILSICASEGREFSVLISSNLLNTDLLSAIKKLKFIQQKYGIIKSIGPQTRYNVKTTVYEFTQAFYKKYFENLLEYEEKVAIHGQIAALLKEKFDTATSEYEKQEIAPYLAAHSLESGDEDTAKSMLISSAQNAHDSGDTDSLQRIYDTFKELGFANEEDKLNDPDSLRMEQLIGSGHNIKQNISLDDNVDTDGENANTGIIGQQSLDFPAVRKTIVQYYHQGRFREGIDYTINFLDKYAEELRSTEQSQFLSLVVKCYIELNELILAEKYLNQSFELIENYHDPIADCFVYNSAAILNYYKDEKEKTLEYLKKAARKSINLSPELKLLTLSNIALIIQEDEPVKANKYFESVRKLSLQLNFQEFADEVLS